MFYLCVNIPLRASGVIASYPLMAKHNTLAKATAAADAMSDEMKYADIYVTVHRMGDETNTVLYVSQRHVKGA